MGMCREYNSFYADAECAEDQLGLPGRVFLHQFPESTPDVEHYTLKEYPQRDLALRCKIGSSWAEPVFDHSSHACVGVLEIVSLHYSLDPVLHYKSILGPMNDIFQDLQMLKGWNRSPLQQLNDIHLLRNPRLNWTRNPNSRTPRRGIKTIKNWKITLIRPGHDGQEGKKELKRVVSVSTLKHVCRGYGIDRWPPRKIEELHSFRPSPIENEGQTRQRLNSDLPSNQASHSVSHTKPTFQDVDIVTIKAKYENNMIKFWVYLPFGLVALQQEVAKRLDLKAETYYVRYKDEENDSILVACDEDLQDCVDTSKSLGNTSVVVLLEPK
ncbi:hypothetical protein RHMOL_Rhmol02G0310800 [Rhododendron molle]|uniref:Uncharacterized protein n=1 Tax=Rhododendron molle TaxID=49168 RepID=A0ACC0PXH5_RHOML|nr:hypothetical protein RHMOL_Rhmol02G0310800 [Rhododendron molle]